MTEDIFNGHGIEIHLEDDDAFLKVRETLSRIGVASRKDKILYPSCYILHKRGLYRILHFKELFALDGRTTDISENDYARRNTIAMLLQDWDLIKIVKSQSLEENVVDLSQIKILTHKEKTDWTINHKYSIGSKKKD